MKSLNPVRLLVCATLLAATAFGQSVVISQIYGGGQGSAAVYRNDFVELFNPGTAAVNLSNYSVQYGSAGSLNWSGKVDLSGTILPGQYFLVQMSSNSGSGASALDLPAPDVASTAVSMSATNGKVALVASTTALGNTACPAPAEVVDLIGYGSAPCFEIAAAPALTTTTAALRGGAGCTDANNNSTDFFAATPAPRNSASAANPCGGTQQPAISVAPSSGLQGQSVNVAVTGVNTTFGPATALAISGPGVVVSNVSAASATSLTATLLIDAAAAPGIRTLTAMTGTQMASTSFTINVPGSCLVSHTIEAIQGSGAFSPLVGGVLNQETSTAVTTRGVVTARIFNGFFIQQTDPAESTKSDGVFIFTGGAPDPAIQSGDLVCVTGPVAEFFGSDPNSPTLTEIDLQRSANIPTDVVPASVRTVIELGTAAIPSAIPLSTSFPSPGGTFDQLEPYEGMRVSVSSLTAVSGTVDSNGNFFAVVTGNARPFREPGIEQPEPLLLPTLPQWNGNPERIKVNSGAQSSTLEVNFSAGQTLTNVQGPLTFSDRTYTIMPDAGFTAGGTLGAAAPVPASQPNDLTVANFNVERFFDTMGSESVSPAAYDVKVRKLSAVIRTVLRAPDVVTLEEVENIDVLSGTSGLTGLVQQIQADGGPLYTPYLKEGNDIGGIDIAFLVNASRVQVVGGDVTQENKDEQFTFNGNTAILNDRPPLVLKARAARPGSNNFLDFTVIGVHQRSLIDVDDPVQGPRVREKRARQAESLANLIRTKYANDKLLVLGDFNGFEFSDGYADVVGGSRGAPAPAAETARPISDLYDPDLIDLGQTFLAASERYSFIFRGNSQMIDHVLASQAMLPLVRFFAIGHPNSEFPESLRSDATRPERASDHDTPIVYIRLPEPAIDVTVATQPSGLQVTVDGVIYTAPRTFQFASGSTHTIGTASLQTLGGMQYTFSGWSDMLAQSHTITVPDGNATYTATFNAESPTGTFGIGAAVTARANGPALNDRVYTVRLTNIGTLPVTACQLTSVTFGSAGITLSSTLPVNYGNLAANGGNASQPVTGNVPSSVSRFVMNLTGSCRSGLTDLPFTTSVTTFR